MSAEDHLLIHAFLLDLYSTYHFSSDHICELIAKHFHYKNIVLFSYTMPLKPYDVMNQYYSKNFRELSIHLTGDLDKSEIAKNYNHRFYREDFFDPFNLPHYLRGMDVLRSSDLPEGTLKSSEYFQYLSSRGLHHILCIYLYRDNICIGRIGIMNPEEYGPFTDREVEMMRMIGKFLSQKLSASVKYEEQINTLNLLTLLTDHLPYGVSILNSRFTSIYANDMADQLAEEIVEEQLSFSSDNIKITGISSLEKIINILQKKYQEDKLLQVEFDSLQKKYSCNLKPVTFTEKNGEKAVRHKTVFVWKYGVV